MPPFMPVSKALGSLVSRTTGSRHLISSAKSDGQLRMLNQFRRLCGTTGIETSSVHKLIGTHQNISSSLANFCQNNGNVLQRRRFLGVGDGEEGDVLSKVYEERRVLGYSPEQLFDVVAAVDLYHGFVPWCQRSETTASDSSLFDHLINIWEFNPGPSPGTCNLYFLVDFKFHSPLYRQAASMFFKEVVSRLVGSFSERCRLIYGPEAPILENTYEQRV